VWRRSQAAFRDPARPCADADADDDERHYACADTTAQAEAQAAPQAEADHHPVQAADSAGVRQGAQAAKEL
jgi:hypothetical protein